MNDWSWRPVIGGMVVLGTFALFALIYIWPCASQLNDLLLLIVGALIANLTTVVNWYFGSSEGSMKKTDASIAIMKSKDDRDDAAFNEKKPTI